MSNPHRTAEHVAEFWTRTNCHSCDDAGLLPDGSPCNHATQYAEIAAAGAAAARAAIRPPKLPRTKPEETP